MVGEDGSGTDGRGWSRLLRGVGDEGRGLRTHQRGRGSSDDRGGGGSSGAAAPVPVFAAD